MTRSAFALGLAFALACAASAQSVFAPLGLGGASDGQRQLGTLDPATGIVALLGGATSIDANDVATASGPTAFDYAGGIVYMVGLSAGSGTSRIYTIDTATGTASSQALSSGSVGTITGIHYDKAASRLVGLFEVAGSDAQVGAIDPLTGTVTLVGAGIGSGALETIPGVLAGDDAAGTLLFVGRTAAGTTNLYSVHTTTGAVTAVALSGVSFGKLAGIEYDGAEAVLYALVAVGADGRQLATIDRTTGVVSLVGSSLGTIDTQSGVTTLDANGNRLLFVGKAGGAWRIYSVDTGTGAATSAVVDESSFKSGLYVGLEFGGDNPVPVQLLSFTIE